MPNKWIIPDIKILFMSGYTSNEKLRKAIEEKKFHFINKPLSLYSFVNKVRNILDH